jgi:DNA-binding response OmpR family regulator
MCHKLQIIYFQYSIVTKSYDPEQLMPGLLGTETVRRMTRPELKVLFVTGYADQFELEGGRDPLVMKPFKPAVLAEAVGSVLRQERYDGGGNIVPRPRREPTMAP